MSAPVHPRSAPTAPGRAIGADLPRVDARAKVTGTATYAFEYPVPHPAYLHPVQATIARGRLTRIDTTAAEALDGVRAVLWHGNAPRLRATDNAELAVLQSDQVFYRGQVVAAVIADTPEAARQAARLVRLDYDQQPHDVDLSPHRGDLYAPKDDHDQGDLEAAMAGAEHALDATYTTPMLHATPIEPHTTTAVWDDSGLTLYESTQGAHFARQELAPLLDLDPQRIQIIAPYVGGGFGSKGPLHAPTVLTVLAARAMFGRPVKLALTRRHMFDQVGYRSPTIQRIRLAANAQGRLSGIGMDATVQTARLAEFIEEATGPTESMYAAPHRHIALRAAELDAAVPGWIRGPGQCPGMFGPEVAMDELAQACGLDPIDLRLRNDPDHDPATGKPFSSRNLAACLREGARRFGWHDRDPAPGTRLVQGWYVGTGVAASRYPVVPPAGPSEATVRHLHDGHYEVHIGAADIGTGAWTVLTQIAADALGAGVQDVQVRIGDTALPEASVAGGSTGTMSWGSTIVAAARAFRDRHGTAPAPGAEASAPLPDNPATEQFAMAAFGAQFAEVHIHADTGEIRVPRLLGAFAAGRIINPRTARSQLIGGMTMGLSMALHEQSIMDPRFGHVVNCDLAEYHIATNADVADIQAHWIDEEDPHVNPLGAKGIGEIGIVGTAAAVANAAHHATGVRVRDLPLTLDHFLG
ncbi:MAG: xanthine dehydrogenase family protein molybdopterin-binding subunit [Nocardiopsaceae bacterium]|nr:xanthine dehydrogenase family protein molybdopterin-binding subunit [Nocardiopsaceae bacterium]